MNTVIGVARGESQSDDQALRWLLKTSTLIQNSYFQQSLFQDTCVIILSLVWAQCRPRQKPFGDEQRRRDPREMWPKKFGHSKTLRGGFNGVLWIHAHVCSEGEAFMWPSAQWWEDLASFDKSHHQLTFDLYVLGKRISLGLRNKRLVNCQNAVASHRLTEVGHIKQKACNWYTNRAH